MQRPRTPSKLSESLHHRLNSYALAASAAGVSLLALAPPAEAKIVYTPVHHVIGPNSRYQLRLNHDKTDFTLVNFASFPTNGHVCSVFQQPAQRGNKAMGSFGRGSVLDWALYRGKTIGPSVASRFYAGNAKLVDSWSVGGCEGSIFGRWYNVTNRYLGLMFQIKGKTHYGWARLSVTVKAETITATLTGYAYETIPNWGIIAGKTKGLDVITVQPATLGALAAGANGLHTWRQK
jgi:hypothetical protein